MQLARLLLVVLAVIVACATPASAQQLSVEDAVAAGFTEYKPTGDALWDTYAQAVLDQLGQHALDFENHPLTIYNSVLPQETILHWEEEFGDDPRFWQLCYVNAAAHEREQKEGGAILKDYAYTGPPALHYLEQAKSLGVMDETSTALLVKERMEELSDRQNRYYNGEIEAASVEGLSPDAGGAEVDAWVEARQLELLDSLVSDCPDESDSLYKRAQYWFELGEWENGLADLQAGNFAAHNRLPMPFPYSFILSAARDGTPVGNEVAAGAVARDLTYLGVVSLASVYRMKENLQSQLLRLNLGASVSELSPWIAHSCRCGSAEWGDDLHRAAGAIFLDMIATYYLIDNADLLTRDQRAAALQLAERAARIGGYLAYERDFQATSFNEFATKIEQLTESYGLTPEDYNSEELDINDAVLQEIQIAGLQLLFAHYWHQMQREHSFLHAELVEGYSQITRFDPVKIEWMPLEVIEQPGD